jgi:hypothetical protein
MYGRINIVIEPLNAIIKSQLRELAYLLPHLRMEQLFNEEEARSQTSSGKLPTGYNFLLMQPRWARICVDGDDFSYQIVFINISQEAGGWKVNLAHILDPELIEFKNEAVGSFGCGSGVIATITIDEVDMIERSHWSTRVHQSAAKISWTLWRDKVHTPISHDHSRGLVTTCHKL